MKHLFSWYVAMIALSALLTIGLAVCHPARAESIMDTADRALTLTEQGNYAEARLALASRTASEQQGALYRAVRGTVDLLAGQSADAETCFREALAQDPQQLAALWGLSICLLQQGRLYEAAPLVDRAAILDPANTRIQTLQAYVYVQFGRLADAATIGKTVLDSGECVPLLGAVLAQLHARMGYPQKAVEFARFAEKHLAPIDLSAGDTGIRLPLSLTAVDTPAALLIAPGETPVTAFHPLATPTETATPETPPRFQITTPAPGSVVQGMQRVQTVYRGRRELSFLVLLVDGVLRGIVSELPYHFLWNSDNDVPGAHSLCVRAYDRRGQVIEENVIAVTTAREALPDPVDPSQQAAALARRIINLTTPVPSLLSLYTQWGGWHLTLQEWPQAIAAFEQATALDPTNRQNLQQLGQLYAGQGLHPLVPNGEITRGPATGKNLVALTFDDGPNPVYTPEIMAELARYDGHATFFVVGKMVKNYPELTIQLLANGHEIANHTYNHPNLTTLSADAVIREMLLNRTLLRSVTGRDTYLCRPPGGRIDAAVTEQLRALDYNIVYWDISLGDYQKLPPEEQAARVLNRVQDGSILLMHNGAIDGTMGALPIILSELHRRGFSFVTVSELMQAQQTTHQ